MNNIAALIEAAGRLHPGSAPDAELIGMLADLLGLAPAPTNLQRSRPGGSGRARPFPEAPAPVWSGTPQSGKGQADVLAADPADHSVLPEPEARSGTDEASLQARPTTLRKVAERADLAPDRDAGRPAASDREPAAGDVDASSAPVESLFAPNRVRAILRGLATVPVPSGEPDMQGVIDLIARAVPVVPFPERSVYALGHAVQLLFDAGPAMLPFARDKQQLASAAARLIGRDRVRVADFFGAPVEGVRMQCSVRWEPFTWPDRRSTVVVVSDLGIGNSDGDVPPVMGMAWREFLTQAARRQVSTVALIPYPASRWPDGVEGFDAALTWDLATGVQSLRRALRSRR